MTDPECPNCRGLGWVCENHPDKTWSERGCQCGAGMPCECQGELSEIDEPDISKLIESPSPVH